MNIHFTAYNKMHTYMLMNDSPEELLTSIHMPMCTHKHAQMNTSIYMLGWCHVICHLFAPCLLITTLGNTHPPSPLPQGHYCWSQRIALSRHQNQCRSGIHQSSVPGSNQGCPRLVTPAKRQSSVSPATCVLGSVEQMPTVIHRRTRMSRQDSPKSLSPLGTP